MKFYPNSIKFAVCKLCEARIAFVKTFPKRALAPLDLPIRSHNLKFDAEGHQVETLQSRTHFDTCPEYRKPKPTNKEQLSLF